MWCQFDSFYIFKIYIIWVMEITIATFTHDNLVINLTCNFFKTCFFFVIRQNSEIKYPNDIVRALDVTRVQIWLWRN